MERDTFITTEKWGFVVRDLSSAMTITQKIEEHVRQDVILLSVLWRYCFELDEITAAEEQTQKYEICNTDRVSYVAVLLSCPSIILPPPHYSSVLVVVWSFFKRKIPLDRYIPICMRFLLSFSCFYSLSCCFAITVFLRSMLLLHIDRSFLQERNNWLLCHRSHQDSWQS